MPLVRRNLSAFAVAALLGGAAYGDLACHSMPTRDQVSTAIQVLDVLCTVVSLAQVDPTATEVCVHESQVSDVVKVLLGDQTALPALPAGASNERAVLVRLPAGKTAKDLQPRR